MSCTSWILGPRWEMLTDTPMQRMVRCAANRRSPETSNGRMNPVSHQDFRKRLRSGGIREADPSVGIGRELSYSDGPLRTVAVHFVAADSPSYRCDVVTRILELEDGWCLATRFGRVADLDLVETDRSTAALHFSSEQRSSLAEYLVTRPIDEPIGHPSTDLYAVSDSGRILVTWDHHTEDDGLRVELRSTRQASRLLSALCDLGTELELFSAARPAP